MGTGATTGKSTAQSRATMAMETLGRLRPAIERPVRQDKWNRNREILSGGEREFLADIKRLIQDYGWNAQVTAQKLQRLLALEERLKEEGWL